MITLCYKKGQIETFERLALGLKAQDIPFCISSDPKTKAVACWGWRAGQQWREKGHDVLVLERAYLGDRFNWVSIGWNGLNGRADFCLPEKSPIERFEKHFKMAKWKEVGEIIVVMGQVVGDMSLMGRDMTAFYNEIGEKCKKAYGLPVYFRPHPAGMSRNLNFKPSLPVLECDYETALALAHLVVTYNSNSAVDAVVRGVPALSFDIGSMAYEVTGHEIGDIVRPDRTEWAAKLAHCQYLPEEIESGVIWDRLKCKLEN